MPLFPPTYIPDVPYQEYAPYHSPDDEELRKSLEAEVIWQWVEQEGGADLPPEVTEAMEDAVADLGWRPMSAAQEMALECTADIILYGGAAGSLKSETLLVNFAVEIDNPNYNAIIFRQSFPELRDLVVKSLKLYPRLGGKFTKGSPMCWRFPSGATIWLGYMAADDDVFAHHGQEYTAIGFDEAGHQNEHRIRYMFTRLRSTDTSLRLRMFLTANPGGPGHAFLMKMFLRGVCPHCEPTRAVEAGKLYTDAVWPSDQQPVSVTLEGGKRVEKTVAFIPGKVTDHALLGDTYVANLMMQASSTAKKLLDGCWKEWEGQFFDCFSETRGIVFHAGGRVEVLQPDIRMIVPKEELKIEWWYPHAISGDYGFSISAAAGHLFVRLPADDRFKKGRMLVLDEYMERGKTAVDYTKELLERWFLEDDPDWPTQKRVPERARSLQMWAISPDAWRKDGSVRKAEKEGLGTVEVAFSRIEQMNEVLSPYGFDWVMANNDRPGGWMKVYQMLRDGELILCKHCVNTIEALQTRLRDPNKFDDVLKVSGDPLDDIIDSLRYGVMTWPMYAEKPRELKVQEAIQGLDPTNAMMTIRKFEIQERGQVMQGWSPKVTRGVARSGPRKIW
jgi:hypothetical protein